MSYRERAFPFEYVSGAVKLPPFGFDAIHGVICVVNAGESDEGVRALGFRGIQGNGSDQIFDSDVTVSPQGPPADGDVAAGGIWRYTWEPPEDDLYFVRIRTTSSNLIPSLDIVGRDPDGYGLGETVTRYRPDDFAFFRRRVRLLPGVSFDDDITSTRR